MSNAANGNTRNVSPGTTGQHGRSCTAIARHLPYWGCLHKHGTCGHVQNVGPHLAAITYGHETSQIKSKHNTISRLFYFITSCKFISLIEVSRTPFMRNIPWKLLPFLTRSGSTPTGTTLNVDHSFYYPHSVSDNMHENMIKSTRL